MLKRRRKSVLNHKGRRNIERKLEEEEENIKLKKKEKCLKNINHVQKRKILKKKENDVKEILKKNKNSKKC